MYALLIDITRCSGCESCVAACIEANKQNPREAAKDRATLSDGLSAHRYSTVLSVGAGRFAKKSCMHCLEPSCVSACLVGGITKTENGPVIYDPDKCIGCRYCMLACPFQVPRYEWEKTIPFMRKCDLCFDRIKAGSLPACVEACPRGALAFGGYEEMLTLARERIKNHPGLYRPHIWGEEEFGGTSVLYISDVDLQELGWPAEPAVSIPSLTEPLIAQTPVIGGGVAAFLLGINWIVRRRIKLAGEESDRDD